MDLVSQFLARSGGSHKPDPECSWQLRVALAGHRVGKCREEMPGRGEARLPGAGRPACAPAHLLCLSHCPTNCPDALRRQAPAVRQLPG